MTLQNPTNVKTYTGNGVTTVFPYDFLIPGDTTTDQSNVEVTLLTIATGVEGAPLADNLWSITGVGEDTYGNVTYTGGGTPLPSTHKINIRRVVPYEQTLDLTIQSAYFPELLEQTLDLIVMQIQQLAEESSRSVQIAIGSSETPEDLIDSLLEATADAEAAATAAGVAESASEAAQTAAEAAQAAAEAAAASINPASFLTIAANPTLVSLEGLSLVAGDVFYATAADTLARLPKGTALQVLRMNAGATAPEWGAGFVAATQAEQEAASLNTVGVTPATQQFHPSALKAWAVVTVSGGTPTLQTGYNITSIADTALGQLTVTIATDFSSANWAYSATLTNTAPNVAVANLGAATTATAALIYAGNIAGSHIDPLGYSLLCAGDQ